MKQTSYYFVIYDDEKMLFNIFRGIHDDTELTSDVAKKQNNGKKIHCSSSLVSNTTYDQLKQNCASMGYTYTDESILQK